MKKEASNWQTLFNRWISGEADRFDERALEAMAKDDPFLADALEGYRSLPEADHARAMEQLHSRLRKRQEKKGRVVVLFLKRIAAVGVILLAAWLVFQWVGSPEDGSLSFNQQTEISGQAAVQDDAVPDRQAREKSTQPGEPESTLPVPDVSAENEVAAVQKQDNSPPSTRPAAEPSPADRRKAIVAEEKAKRAEQRQATERQSIALSVDKMAARESAVYKNDTVEEAILQPIDKDLMTEEIAAPRPPAEDSARSPVSLQKEDGIVARTIKGQVTDASGEPLIGASITISGTSLGVVTDVDGAFTIESPTENPLLTVAYTGFVSQEVRGREGDFLTIRLVEGVPLDEVVVTGKRAEVKRNNVTSSVSTIENDQEFRPRGGLEKFEKYIRQNLRKPQAARDAGISGQVVVGFSLNDAGRPSDFKILRSLGSGCDEEAIRLLQEGPKWKGPAGVRHSYTFVFE